MKTPSFRRLAAVRLAAALALGAAFAGAHVPAQAQSIAPHTDVTIRPAKTVIGWQGAAPVSIPASQGSAFIHYGCPTGTVVDSGAYFFNEQGQNNPVAVTFNGPRLDEDPAYFGEWGWSFAWPAGAPSGLTVTVDIHCVKK
jgi:hypothetical protein